MLHCTINKNLKSVYFCVEMVLFLASLWNALVDWIFNLNGNSNGRGCTLVLFDIISEYFINIQIHWINLFYSIFCKYGQCIRNYLKILIDQMSILEPNLGVGTS